MITKEVKTSPIFGEFSPKEQDRYFSLLRDKVRPHVDTLYYTVSIFQDSNEGSEGMQLLLDRLRGLKIQKSAFPSASLYFFDLSVELKRFVHYDFCLSLGEHFDIFISSILPNTHTPRIVVQLRSRFLVLDGDCQAVCKSFRYIEDILGAFGLEIDDVKENRIDFAYHTNLIQNPFKFLRDERLKKYCKMNFRDISKHITPGKEYDIDYISFGNKKSNNVFVRIYNKSREVIEMNYKAFFIEKWFKEKLISEYDRYVYTRAYELKSYVTGVLIGRIDWYLEYGHNEEIKKELSKVKQSCYVNSDNTDQLRKIVDSYLPPVTLVLNIEFQTMRKFYSTLDDFIKSFGIAYELVDGKYQFYERGVLPLFRVFAILGSKGQICNYLTSEAICFVDNKGKSTEKMQNWWKKIHECYIEDYNKKVFELYRTYERHANLEKTKRRLCSTVATVSVLQNNGLEDSNFLEDVSDVLCSLNDNDFYGFAPNPETGEFPDLEPVYYRDLKVRKERQYRPLIKEKKILEKKFKENIEKNSED